MTAEDANVNVYLASEIDTRDKTKINATRLYIPENSEQRFHIVLADMDDASITHIKSGAKLIINVPRDWTNVIIDNNSGFNTPIIRAIGDSSYQIIAETSGPTGDTTVARTISFNATAPDVSNNQMYIMYVLAEGVVDTGGSDFAIGPLAEIVLQVIP